jgi:hypothetical protein
VVVVDVKDLECVGDDRKRLAGGHSLGDVGHHAVDGGCVVGMAFVKSQEVEVPSCKSDLDIVGMVASTLEMAAMHILKQPVDMEKVGLDVLGKLEDAVHDVVVAYTGCAALGLELQLDLDPRVQSIPGTFLSLARCVGVQDRLLAATKRRNSVDRNS